MQTQRWTLFLLAGSLTIFVVGCSETIKQSPEEIDLQEKRVLEAASQLGVEQRHEEALLIVEEAIDQLGPTRGLIGRKYQTLLALERYEDALETFEIVLQQVGDAPDIVIDKVRLLVKLGRFEEALEVAIPADEKSVDKSLYLSSYISLIHAHLGNKDGTLQWLERSVVRGDVGFDYYLGEEFTLIHSDPRFVELIEMMKENAGIGVPAKDFTIPVVSGGEYTLSKDLGKVVLIDFWATWCSPCIAEFPRLKDLYRDLHDKGFEIIGVSLDSEIERLESFLGKQDVPWQIGFSGEAMEGKVARLYGVDAAPRYWVVDRKGIVRYSFETGGEKVSDAVRELVSDQ